MLLGKTLERNPQLLRAALELHQDGVIPTATHVIDLDAVADNAQAISSVARNHGLRALVMAKQSGHDPHMTRVALDRGMDAAVANEAIQAHRIHRFGFPLGNVGHPSNLPKHEVARVIETMKPDFVTVWTQDAARRVSAVASQIGRIQPLYVSVANCGDEGAHREIIGGWTEDNCVEGIGGIIDLPNIEVAGLAQHISVSYESQDDAYDARPTEAFCTTLRAKELLERELDLADLKINCAGNVNAANAPMLARHGATEIEPGAALVGSSRFHAIQSMPERPAQVYVTEISHHWDGNAYARGGGFNFVWDMGGRLLPFRALVGSSFEEACEQVLTFQEPPWYDVFGMFADPDQVASPGDTLLFSHLAQAVVERGYVAAVSGVSRGQPKLEALLDNAANVLDEDRNPVPVQEAMLSVDRVAREYARRGAPPAAEGLTWSNVNDRRPANDQTS